MVDFILGLLFLASVAGMVLGLVKPEFVLHWGKKRTRLRAVGWYGLFALLTFVAIGIIAPAPQQSRSQAEQAASAPAKPEPAVPVVAEPAKQPEPQPVVQVTPTAPTVDAAKMAEEKAAKEHAEAQAKENSKARVRAFEKDLRGYDTVSALAMETAKAMTRRVGKDATLGDVYAAVKEARQYAQAGANEVLKLRVPDVPEPVATALKEAKEASWQMLIGRRKSLDAFMDWLDSRKPSDQAKMQEESNFSTLQAAKCVESLLKAKAAAGFTEEEIKAYLKADGGDTREQSRPIKSKRGKLP